MTLQKITSRDNSRLVRVRRVRDGREGGWIFIEGRRLAGEALRSSLVIDECFITEALFGDQLLSQIAERTDLFFELPEKVFCSIADTKQPQGIILLAQHPPTGSKLVEKKLALSSPQIAIYLQQINDPANLGAILRTAEAAGSAGVIVSENSADVFSPKSLRASMGAAFRVPVWENAEFEVVMQWAKSKGLVPTATSASSKLSYTDVDWRSPRLLIFGSEAHGLSTEQLAAVGETINIQMENEVESLNLAVSAGVILFEAKRQNGIAN